MAWKLEPGRYMPQEDVRRLRKSTRDLAILDLADGRETWVRGWAIIDLVSNTGLRVSEVAKIRVGHLRLRGYTPSLIVFGGKGRADDQGERVSLGTGIVRRLREFIEWKEREREDVTADGHLFITKRGGPYGVRTLQQLFKRACAKAGLDSGYSIHALRHSYGTYLYQKTKDLRLVQKELRHKSVTTTQVYTDITPECSAEAVNDVWDDDDTENE